MIGPNPVLKTQAEAQENEKQLISHNLRLFTAKEIEGKRVSQKTWVHLGNDPDAVLVIFDPELGHVREPMDENEVANIRVKSTKR